MLSEMSLGRAVFTLAPMFFLSFPYCWLLDAGVIVAGKL
jgi:hypothetical protein